jgi:hypothetical protein
MTAPNPKPAECPACGSADVCEIVYSYPAPDLAADAQHADVVLGGCVIERESPRWACRACKREWGRIGDNE